MANDSTPEERPFGPALRSARALARISLAELGERIGKNRSTISRWEQGITVPDRDDVAMLEKALGITDGRLHAAAGYLVEPANHHVTVDISPYLLGLNESEKRIVVEAVRAFVSQVVQGFRE